MALQIEILIPLRNPPEIFRKTIDSLLSQTDQDFSVLISDNFSTKGQEFITDALARLRAGGITVRKIQPPFELERVEHWNWLHHQSAANWFKPLFAGDWLEPGYVVQLKKMAVENLDCRYVFTNGFTHYPDGTTSTSHNRWAGRFNTAAEMQGLVLRYGMQFGPPSAAAYERTAFFALGGYPTTLPITADSLFYCTLAARFGVAGIQEKLCHFNIHTQRFSTTLPGKRRDTLRESMTYIAQLGYHAWTERDLFPCWGFFRLFVRTLRNYVMAK